MKFENENLVCPMDPPFNIGENKDKLKKNFAKPLKIQDYKFCHYILLTFPAQKYHKVADKLSTKPKSLLMWDFKQFFRLWWLMVKYNLFGEFMFPIVNVKECTVQTNSQIK